MAVSTSVLNRDLALAFADVLSYPHSPIAGHVQACEELAGGESEEAAALLGRFGAFAAATPLGELQEAIVFFNTQGTPVKLPGIGTFGVSVSRDGQRRISFISSGPLRRGVNGELGRDLPVANSMNIGLDNAGLKALWDAEHPDDPLEI